MTRFTVWGDPRPKQRPRVPRFAKAYTPRETLQAEDRVRTAARAAGVELLEGPVALHVRFFRATGRRVDNDNLLKLVQDALNGIAYRDDSQIVVGSHARAIDRDRPRTEIEVGPAMQAGASLTTTPSAKRAARRSKPQPSVRRNSP